jgi:hypothetical protein
MCKHHLATGGFSQSSACRGRPILKPECHGDAGLRRYECSQSFLRVQGKDCECGHDHSGQVWFQQSGVRPVPTTSAHFAQQPSGTTDRQDDVTRLSWPAPFSLKLNPAHVVRGIVAVFDPSALPQAYGAASLPRPNDKPTEPPRSARNPACYAAFNSFSTAIADLRPRIQSSVQDIAHVSQHRPTSRTDRCRARQPWRVQARVALLPRSRQTRRRRRTAVEATRWRSGSSARYPVGR